MPGTDSFLLYRFAEPQERNEAGYFADNKKGASRIRPFRFGKGKGRLLRDECVRLDRCRFINKLAEEMGYADTLRRGTLLQGVKLVA